MNPDEKRPTVRPGDDNDVVRIGEGLKVRCDFENLNFFVQIFDDHVFRVSMNLCNSVLSWMYLDIFDLMIHMFYYPS